MMVYRSHLIVRFGRQGRLYSTSASTSSWPQKQREKEMRDRFIRVDYAGELGADRIYAGQMAVLG